MTYDCIEATNYKNIDNRSGRRIREMLVYLSDLLHDFAGTRFNSWVERDQSKVSCLGLEFLKSKTSDRILDPEANLLTIESQPGPPKTLLDYDNDK